MPILVDFSEFYPKMTRLVPHVEAVLECRVDTSTGFLVILPASSQPATDPALATSNFIKPRIQGGLSSPHIRFLFQLEEDIINYLIPPL
jgi:hypothetical protein